MTFRELIQMAGELRPHSYSEPVLFRWLTALDGKLAATVFLMAPEEFRLRDYTYPDALEYEPLVTYPHQEMYVQYLIAQIDLAMGENEQYQNDMAVYNESYGAFVRWFATRYAPGNGYGSGCNRGCSQSGSPPYYLTAYGLAVQQGYSGTLEQWLRSLRGDSVELRAEGNVLQFRSVTPEGAASGEWTDICKLDAFAPYLPIQILSIRNSSPINELGSSAAGIELFWVLSKEPVSALLDGVQVETDPDYAGTDNAAYSADKTWSLVVTDERGVQVQADTTAAFVNGVYFGTQFVPVDDEGTVCFDSAFVLSLEKQLRADRAVTFTADAADVDDFIWFCVPERYGECVFYAGGLAGGFSLMDTIAFTNAYGYTENYRIYRSDYGGLGETTVEVT